MALLDKLRALRDEPADRDLADFLGAVPTWNRESVTVGDETVPMVEARAAVLGGPIEQTPEPRRVVTIGDL